MEKAEVSKKEFVLDGYENFDGSKKNSFILFSAKGLKCKTDKTIFQHTFIRSIEKKDVEFVLRLKTFRDCDSTFVLTIRLSDSSKLIRKSLILEGAGSDLIAGLAGLAINLAEGFCEANKLQVCTRFSHSPLLEYLVQEDHIAIMHKR